MVRRNSTARPSGIAEPATAEMYDQLLIDYNTDLILQLRLGNRVVLDCPWNIEVQVDQVPVPVDGEWHSVCWNTDEDADYLELHMTTSRGMTVECQCIFSRIEPWVMLAVKVSRARGKRVDVTSVWRTPLKVVAGEAGTRELRTAGTPGVRIFPLALPQETVVGTTGSFSFANSELKLHQACAGTGLYAPVLLDWDLAHRRIPANWRTLTVTEDSRVLPPDEAAGHRLRVGAMQLLLYHALQPAHEARAVLGHNTRYETMIGRFKPSGDVDSILAIEPDSEE